MLKKRGHPGVLVYWWEDKNSNATWFGKWCWLCCTQTGIWGQRGMETQRKDVKNLLYSRKDCWWWWWLLQSFNLLVKVPGLPEDSNSLKIRMLPGLKDLSCITWNLIYLAFLKFHFLIFSFWNKLKACKSFKQWGMLSLWFFPNVLCNFISMLETVSVIAVPHDVQLMKPSSEEMQS